MVYFVTLLIDLYTGINDFWIKNKETIEAQNSINEKAG